MPKVERDYCTKCNGKFKDSELVSVVDEEEHIGNLCGVCLIKYRNALREYIKELLEQVE